MGPISTYTFLLVEAAACVSIKGREATKMINDSDPDSIYISIEPPELLPEELPELLSEEVPELLPEEVPELLSEEVPELLSEEVPELLSEKYISDKI